MADSIEPDDIPPDLQAIPRPEDGRTGNLPAHLLSLHAAQETGALADSLASIVASPNSSVIACAFVDDGSGLLTPLVGQQDSLHGLADVRLSAAEPGPVADVLTRGEMVVSDNLKDLLGVEIADLTFRRALLCRLSWEAEALGIVLFCDQGDVDLELYLRLAEHISLALVRLRTLTRTYRFGGIDPAQWVFDREWLSLRFEEEVARARRYGRPLGLLLFHFQNLDALTEAAGTQQTGIFLRRAAAVIRGQIRTPDLLAGYGEATVAVLLPETERVAAVATSARIASRLRQLGPGSTKANDWVPDLRVGVAGHPEDGETAADLITAAESGLNQDEAPEEPIQKTA